MDKKRKKYKDDYSLRTLAYYQREGGVYNELITILQRIRTEKGNSRLLAPNTILNKATEAYDIIIDYCLDSDTGIIYDYGLEELSWELYGGCVAGPLVDLKKKDELVILCVLCVLLSRHSEFFEMSIPELVQIVQEKDFNLYESFGSLINRELEKPDSQLESLKNQLAMKDAIIKDKDSQLAQLSKLNSIQREMIDETKGMLQAYMRKTTELPIGLDGILSLESILEWIKNRQHYTLSDQVFSMLKDLGRKIATDEEYERISNLEKEMLANYKEQKIVNNNMGFGSNFLTGLAQNPMMPIGVTTDQIVQRFIEFMSNGGRRENKD